MIQLILLHCALICCTKHQLPAHHLGVHTHSHYSTSHSECGVFVTDDMEPGDQYYLKSCSIPTNWCLLKKTKLYHQLALVM